MKYTSKKQSIQILFSLIVFSVFAVSSLVVVIFGARVYKTTNINAERNFDIRTSISYIAQKTHQNDRANSIEVTSFGDGDALIFNQDIDGDNFKTLIYVYENNLYELFISDDVTPNPEGGQQIMKLNKLSAKFVLDNTLYIKTENSNGDFADIYLNLRTM